MRMRLNLLKQAGSTLLEVMITLVIMVFGLLGIAGVQAEIHRLELESYQRSQAIVLLNNMADRMKANRSQAAKGVYAINGFVGIGSDVGGSGDDCSALTGVDQDKCEWSKLLKGAAEKSGENPIGAMSEARGCISAFSQKIAGYCQTGYQIDVVWLAVTPSVVSQNTCAGDQFAPEYGAYRRVISTRIATGASIC